MFRKKSPNVAQLMVKCLENEGVKYLFGLPGEENIDLIDALKDSPIRFILTRHEQGASFMADIYGRLTHHAGVCLATLGPGAINLLLGTADAQLDSSPLVAIVAQAALDRINKESHQVIDLVALFRPVTKWAAMITSPDTTHEVVRKAFKLAQSERRGACCIVLPEDIAEQPAHVAPLPVKQPIKTEPNQNQILRAAELIHRAKNVVILAGNGVFRQHACDALKSFAEKTRIPVAVTFMAKGAIPANHPLSLGTLGFMKHDYVNFGFDHADTIITIGYDLVEYAPQKWNPKNDKKIIHIHIPAEVDDHYNIEVGLQGDLSSTLDALAKAVTPRTDTPNKSCNIRRLIDEELTTHAHDTHFPLKPQKIVSDIRAAMGEKDIVLCDTGALKMWMARLYPCYYPNTCLISNSLATMAFSLPGAIGAKLAHPDRKILAVMGDGSFLMNSQELETARRENIPFVILIWVDGEYGLIKWKQELEFGRSAHISFSDPDFVKYADSFGIPGYHIKSAQELLPTLKKALARDELCIIACPVDYSENMKLTKKLGELTGSI